MCTDVSQVSLDNFRVMVGVVDLDASERYLGPHLVKQGGVIEGEAAFAATRMGDKADRTAAVCRIHRLGHISHNRDKTGLAHHPERGLPVAGVAMLAQKATIVHGPDQFTAILSQYLLLARKGIAPADQFIMNFVC